MDLHRQVTALRPLVRVSLNIVATTAAGPGAVGRPYSLHPPAGLTDAELFHSNLGKPQRRFNLPV